MKQSFDHIVEAVKECGKKTVAVSVAQDSAVLEAVKAAKELFIHRSTFLYRMSHIRELIHIDLEDPDQLLYLLLTYKLFEMEENEKGTGRTEGGTE